MTDKATPLRRRPLGIYIHVPFCMRKCGYCGFYSIPLREEALAEYTKTIESQILNQSFVPREVGDFDVNRYFVDSIFLGGGTPSLLSSESMQRILSAVDSVFCIDKDAEITVEANPGTLNLDKLLAYKSAGISRISLGIQSFDDYELRQIGRIHDTEVALKTIEACRRARFENLNLDLIFSLPNQTLKRWEKNLKAAINLSPEHLSIYGLQLEEGTEFFECFKNGEFDETSDELDRQMYHQTCDMLKDSGFAHYEISNWSKPGYECRHNLKYWQFIDYLGIGPSAASFLNGFRFEVVSSLTDFMLAHKINRDLYRPDEIYTNIFSEVHQNTLKDSAGEFAFTALRTVEGISFDKFKSEFGIDFMKFYKSEKSEIEYYIELGYLNIDENGIRLTRSGIDISNSIMSLFV